MCDCIVRDGADGLFENRGDAGLTAFNIDMHAMTMKLHQNELNNVFIYFV